MRNMPMRFPRSKTGTVFAVLYGLAAIILFPEAVTCKVWMCEFTAWPVWLPMGYLFWLPYSGHLDYVPDPTRHWNFIIPAFLANVLLWYIVGMLLGKASSSLYGRYVLRSQDR